MSAFSEGRKLLRVMGIPGPVDEGTLRMSERTPDPAGSDCVGLPPKVPSITPGEEPPGIVKPPLPSGPTEAKIN